MNILLFLPAFGLLSLRYIGWKKTFLNAFSALLVQVALAWPFLRVNAKAYLAQSFELSRVFLYRWTVNWKFVGERIFYQTSFHWLLFLAHLTVLTYYLYRRFAKSSPYFKGALKRTRFTLDKSPSTRVTILFVTNFIGIVFARSLHYQFYSWYFYSIPFLLWKSRLPTVVQLALFVVIEFCWNCYPASAGSSFLLLAAHVALLSKLLH